MKNKKISLGLVASSLTILPMTVLISCSSSTPIETEVAKFETPTRTIIPGIITANEAVSRIQSALGPINKLNALKVFANVPTLGEGFDFEVLSASINETTDSTVDVLIQVFEKENKENVIDVIYMVEGFVPLVSAIDKEAAKFNQPVETLRPHLSSNEAVARVNNASTPQDAFVALRELAVVPELSRGFEFTGFNATISTTKKTTIDVSITISRTIITEVKTVTFRVEGFSTDIIIESEKFEEPVQNTKPGFITGNEAVFSIESASNPTDKLRALRVFADVPTLDAEFNFEVLSAMINTTSNSTVDVLIKVFEKDNQENFKEIVYKVQGFIPLISTIDIEAAKFDKTVEASKPDLFLTDTLAMINNASTPEEAIIILNEVAEVPTLEEGFVFEVLGAITSTREAMDVSISVSRILIPEVKTVTFRVTNLKETPLEIEARRFEVERRLTSGISIATYIALIEVTNTTENKIISTNSATDQPIPTPSPGFKIEVGLAILDPNNSLMANLEIRVIEESTNNFQDVYLR
ncbi:MAG: hypothetical protein ACRC1F_00915, partial [Metamycoplasmataceae bacterium]